MIRKAVITSIAATVIGTASLTVNAGYYAHCPAEASQAHAMKLHTPHAMGQASTERPRLGVLAADIPLNELDKLSLEYGVTVARVMQGSLAAKQGLRNGDVITEIDNRPVYSAKRLQHLIANATAETSITVVRDGEKQQVKVDFTAGKTAETTGKAALGVRIQPMTNALKQAFGSADSSGVLISEVMDGSAAGKAGVKAGDVVTRIGDRQITSVRDIHAVFRYVSRFKVEVSEANAPCLLVHLLLVDFYLVELARVNMPAPAVGQRETQLGRAQRLIQ